MFQKSDLQILCIKWTSKGSTFSYLNIYNDKHLNESDIF